MICGDCGSTIDSCSCDVSSPQKQLFARIDQVVKMYIDIVNIQDRQKYKLLMNRHNNRIQPLIDKLELHFDWVDNPKTTFAVRSNAYIDYLLQWRKDLYGKEDRAN